MTLRPYWLDRLRWCCGEASFAAARRRFCDGRCGAWFGLAVRFSAGVAFCFRSSGSASGATRLASPARPDFPTVCFPVKPPGWPGASHEVSSPTAHSGCDALSEAAGLRTFPLRRCRERRFTSRPCGFLLVLPRHSPYVLFAVAGPEGHASQVPYMRCSATRQRAISQPGCCLQQRSWGYALRSVAPARGWGSVSTPRTHLPFPERPPRWFLSRTGRSVEVVDSPTFQTTGRGRSPRLLGLFPRAIRAGVRYSERPILPWTWPLPGSSGTVCVRSSGLVPAWATSLRTPLPAPFRSWV